MQTDVILKEPPPWMPPLSLSGGARVEGGGGGRGPPPPFCSDPHSLYFPLIRSSPFLSPHPYLLPQFLFPPLHTYILL